jgi:hypothetical protein
MLPFITETFVTSGVVVIVLYVEYLELPLHLVTMATMAISH